MASPTTSTADNETLRDRLVGLDEGTLAGLKRTYEWDWVNSRLRGNAIINIFFGGLTLWLGVLNIDGGIISIIQILLGLSLLIIAILSIVNPSTKRILQLSMVFFVFGCWNIWISVLQASVILIPLGLLQILWAYQFIQFFRKHDDKYESPTAEQMKVRDDLWQATLDAAQADSNQSHTIDLKMSGSGIWKGILTGDILALAYERKRWLFIGTQTDFAIIPKNKEDYHKRAFAATLHYVNRKTPITIPKDSFDKFVRWKGLGGTL